jgi:NAD(P)-dependent dehydrogenase (short-subunit alcohol dehydrogenase family)
MEKPVNEPRTIVLTGCTRGLGRELTDRFVERGHTVLGCGRSSEHVADLAGRHGPPHDFQDLDVSDRAAVNAWGEGLVASHGAPDLVINNAALMNHPAPLWEVPADEFETLMAVNVNGTLNVIRVFVPAMIAAGRGVIANLSSGWGRSTAPEVGPYCTSKFAIEGLSGSLAQELPAGMAAVAVSPGVVDTDMLRKCWDTSAGAYPKPAEWGERAADFFLDLGPGDNGASLRI